MNIPEQLPTGWRLVSFGEVACEVSASTRNPVEDGFERYVGLEHFDTDSLSIKRWGLIEEDNPTFTKVFREGQLLFGRRRSYQRKAAVADFDGICSGDIIVMEAKPEQLLPDLLPFIVQSNGFFDHAIQTSAGSLSPRTKWASLATYQFPLPPLDEQHRIAEILWATEDAIEKWKSSLVAVNHSLEIFREEKLSDIRFERQKLGNHLLRIVAGKSVLGMNIPAKDNEYGVLKVSAVGSNGFVPSENKRLIRDTDFIENFSIHSGDLLITRANTTELVGRVCIVPSNYNNLMLSDKTLRLDPKSTIVVDFLLEVLRTKSVRNQIETAATGTSGSMKNISQSDIKNLLIPIPDIAIQMQLIDKMSRLHQVACMISEHIAKLTQMRMSIVENWLYPSEVAHVQRG
jgi:type I restriction enzyme S subunit